jgi:hypothetical protein
MISLLMLLWGCQPQPQPQPSQGGMAPMPSGIQSRCEGIVDDEVRAYCRYINIISVRELDSARQVCAEAGVWEDRCLETWVSSDHAQAPREALLSLCKSEECSFHALDRNLDADIDLQIALCQEHVPRYLSDCIDHALRAWEASAPSQEALQALSERDEIDGMRLGRALGEVVRCVPDRQCAGSPAVERLCLLAAARPGPCRPSL